MEDRIREQWEINAESFTSLIAGSGTPHHKQILNPCVEELLGDVRNKKLLDAGCGEGYLARYYAKKGAFVTAIDLSQRLIETAKKLTKKENVVVEYKVANICNLDSIPDEEYDIILSNLVLLNIPCLDDSFREFYRILRKDGYLVFSIVHPAFNFYGPGSWEMGEKNPDTGRREGIYFKIDNYFDEKEFQRYWTTRQGDKFPAVISFFHRTLSTYLNNLFTTGLNLQSLSEPKPIIEDSFFDRETRIPFFVVCKAQKK
jgi:ubiquinone/menaquinone biosynthesis C-methylase UbiE